MTVTAEVKEGFREFSGMGSSNNNRTATIGAFMVDFDGGTVKRLDGMGLPPSLTCWPSNRTKTLLSVATSRS